MSDSEYRSISRRTFLKLAGGSAALAAILAACGPGATPAPTTAPAATTAPAQPTTAPAATAPANAAPTAKPTAAAGKAGGQLRYAMNNEPDSLDPAKTAQASAYNVMLNLYDT